MMPQALVRWCLPAWIALRTYWPAILTIQFLALGVVIIYYRWDGAGVWFGVVSDWQRAGGLWFAALSTVLSGGVFPELLKRRLRPAGEPGPSRRELLHQFAMWAILGVLVSRFYYLQELVYGSGNDAFTLILKVATDQLVFTPLVSLPFIVSWFLLYESGYRLKAWWKALTFALLWRRIQPLWATVLAFWPGMLLIIYSLPGDLQFPCFLFGNAAFSILMIFIVRRQAFAGVDPAAD